MGKPFGDREEASAVESTGTKRSSNMRYAAKFANFFTEFLLGRPTSECNYLAAVFDVWISQALDSCGNTRHRNNLTTMKMIDRIHFTIV